MKLGIIEVGKVPADLKDQYAPYPVMFEDLLRPHAADMTVTVFDVLDRDEIPNDPAAQDAWLITGSPAGVYEGHAWIAPLEDFIRTAHNAKTPMVGICFGHQLIAQALGGKVIKSEKGWGTGLHHYDLADGSGQIAINAMHQDQVVEKPAVASVWVRSDFCPNAGLVYGSHILTLQPHPEFAPDYETALISARRGTLIPEETAAPALAGLEGLDKVADAARVAKWMANVLSGKPTFEA